MDPLIAAADDALRALEELNIPTSPKSGMTANNHLRIDETLTLLRRLREVTREAGAREAALEKELRLRSSQARRAREQDLETQEAALTLEREALESVWRDAEAAMDASIAQRRAVISRARAACVQVALAQVNHAEGNRKLALQTHIRDTERARVANKQAAEQAFADGRQALQERRQDIVALVQTVHKVMEDYAGLLPRPEPDAAAAVADEPTSFDQHIAHLEEGIAEVREGLHHIQRLPQALLFRLLPPPLAVTVVLLSTLAAFGVLLHQQRFGRSPYLIATISATAVAALLVLLYASGRRRIAPLATKTSGTLQHVMSWHGLCDPQPRPLRSRTGRAGTTLRARDRRRTRGLAAQPVRVR